MSDLFTVTRNLTRAIDRLTAAIERLGPGQPAEDSYGALEFESPDSPRLVLRTGAGVFPVLVPDGVLPQLKPVGNGRPGAAGVGEVVMPSAATCHIYVRTSEGLYLVDIPGDALRRLNGAEARADA